MDATETFWHLHRGLPRQAPGSDATTRRLLSLADPLPAAGEALDLGCGPGRASLVLARETGLHVTAVDTSAEFLARAGAGRGRAWASPTGSRRSRSRWTPWTYPPAAST